MQGRGEGGQLLKDLYSKLNTQFNADMKGIRIDNTIGFTSNPSRTFYEQKGTLHQISSIDTSHTMEWLKERTNIS